MLKNYFIVAFRSLRRNRNYTFINVAGLSVGIAACMLIFLVVKFELSFDNFYPDPDRIYRLVTIIKSPEGTNYTAGIPFPVPEGLRVDYPQLKNVAAIYGTEGQINIIDKDGNTNNKFGLDKGIFYAEPQFFDIFNFGWLAGDPETALSDPHTAVLTEETAQKYFGTWQNAMGRTLKFDNKYVYKITGILKNIPANSDFPLKIVFSYNSLKYTDIKRNFEDWVTTFSRANCFIVLPQNMKTSEFESYLNDFVKKHKPPEYVNEGLSIQPLREMHFDSRFGNLSDKTFSKELIGALSLIAFFVLIIACMNFINLSTAQAVNRAREVGIRKVMGGKRKQLIIQFMIETSVIVIMSVVFAYALAELLLPELNEFLRLHLTLNIINDPASLVFIFLMTLLIILLSGFYPAIILSRFSPVSILKSKVILKTFGGISLRRGLVIFQFVISQILIISMFVVVSQMNFFKNSSLGFDKNQVVIVPIPGDSLSLTKVIPLKNMLQQQSSIESISLSTFSPIDDSHWSSDFMFDNSTNNTDFNADLMWADADYFNLFNLQFIAGRAYGQSDTVTGFVVNETLVQKLGFHNPEDIIGKKINFWKGELIAPVVGVVKDFHSHPLKSSSGPVVFGNWKAVFDMMSIKISPHNVKKTLEGIKKSWESTYPENIYDFKFLDDKIDGFYKKEDQLSVLYKIFAGLAILISCLGLFGLVSFMTVQRTKEVGIRKVLGASAKHIILLFSKEFTLLIIIAFLIAAPTAYFIMNDWLQNFAYHVGIGAWLFLSTAVISVILAWLTVGYHSIKAAAANPVKSLKYE